MRRKENSSDNLERPRSHHARDDLEVVPEAAGHLERPSINYDSRASSQYEDYGHYNDGEDYLDRMEGSMRLDPNMRQLEAQSRNRDRVDLMERSERSDKQEGRVDRSGDFSRQDSVSRGPSSMSVVSDVSYGDKPYHSMPVISLAQDSGSLLPHLNTSHKSTCSMTHGSKRMAEKRAAMLRSGSILYCDQIQDKKKKEDLDLAFTRWGGRKDYSNRTGFRTEDRKRKLALQKIHKRQVKAEKRASLVSGRSVSWGECSH